LLGAPAAAAALRSKSKQHRWPRCLLLGAQLHQQLLMAARDKCLKLTAPAGAVIERHAASKIVKLRSPRAVTIFETTCASTVVLFTCDQITCFALRGQRSALSGFEFG